MAMALIPPKPVRKMKRSGLALLAALLLVCVFSIRVNEATIVVFVGILSAIGFFGVACREFNLAARLGTKEFLGISGVAGLVAAMGMANLPLRIVFFAFQGEFDRLAGELAAGKPVRFPASIGPFELIAGGVRDQTPYFIDSGNANEINGFVNHPEGHGFNIWSVTPLGRDWAYVSED